MHKLSNLLLIDKVLQQMGLWSSATPLFVRRVSVWHMGVVEQATVLFDEVWPQDEFKDHIRSEVPLQLKNTNQQTPYTPHFYSTTRSLQALRVPIILDLASGARNAGCRASPTLTTTLTPVGSSTTARARRSSRSSRSSSLRSLDHSRQGTLEETAEVAGLDDAAAAEVAGAALLAPQLMTAGPGALYEVQGHLVRCGR
ncbi:hypothetical protein KCU75_g15, partial [Aureobasidium melanogenum]